MQVLTGGDVHEHGVAAVLLGHQAVLGELTADLLRVGVRLVDLVHGHHDRHVRRLGVVERLDGLRHHAVVRGDHEHGDVRDLCTTGTHRGERLVTRGVDERDEPFLTVHLGGDLVRTDVLGDAAGLTLDHLGVTDRVQQAGLTVVHVTHDGDHRRARCQDVLALGLQFRLEVDVEGLEQLALLVLRGDHLDLVAELGT